MTLGQKIIQFDNLSVKLQTVEFFNYLFSAAKLDAPLDNTVEIYSLANSSTCRWLRVNGVIMKHEFNPSSITLENDNENNMGDIYCDSIDDEPNPSNRMHVNIEDFEEI